MDEFVIIFNTMTWINMVIIFSTVTWMNFVIIFKVLGHG